MSTKTDNTTPTYIPENYTLAERAKYLPGTFSQNELIDLLTELEAWRSIADNQDMPYWIETDDPNTLKNHIVALVDSQISEDQQADLAQLEDDYKPFWSDCLEAAGGAHYLGHPDIWNTDARNYILTLIEKGREVNDKDLED